MIYNKPVADGEGVVNLLGSAESHVVATVVMVGAEVVTGMLFTFAGSEGTIGVFHPFVF